MSTPLRRRPSLVASWRSSASRCGRPARRAIERERRRVDALAALAEQPRRLTRVAPGDSATPPEPSPRAPAPLARRAGRPRRTHRRADRCCRGARADGTRLAVAVVEAADGDADALGSDVVSAVGRRPTRSARASSRVVLPGAGRAERSACSPGSRRPAARRARRRARARTRAPWRSLALAPSTRLAARTRSQRTEDCEGTSVRGEARQGLSSPCLRLVFRRRAVSGSSGQLVLVAEPERRQVEPVAVADLLERGEQLRLGAGRRTSPRGAARTARCRCRGTS